MSIIGGILASVNQEPSAAFGDPSFWSLGQGRRTTAGEYVSGETALALPVYWACLQAISTDVGKLSLKVYRKDGENKAPDDSHPLYPLLHDEPNPEMSAMTFRETVTQWAMGWGNGYAEIVRNGRGQPVELWPIHPSRVEVKRDESDSLYYKIRPADQVGRKGKQTAFVDTRLDLDSMFHVRGMGSGVEGYSVFRAASESIGHAIATRRFGAAFFGNGIHASGMLQHPGQLGDKALKHLRDSFEQEHGGPENAHKPMILEEDMKWVKTSVNPEEAQFLESMEFDVEEVCRWFRMPPHKIQHLKRTTYNNIEHQSIEYVVDTLFPWLRRWEDEIRRKLFLPAERGTYFAEHNIESLLRADSKARAEFYQIMQQNGNLTINDVLRRENMNGIGPAGDQRFVPLNMTTAERMLAGPPEPQAKPTGQTTGKPAMEPMPEDEMDDEEMESRLQGLTAMFHVELSRAVKRQAVNVTAAGKKHKGDAGAFEGWLRTFYAGGARVTGLESELADALGAIGDGLDKMGPGRNAGATARAFAADHCKRSAAVMRDAFAEGAEGDVAAGWEVNGRAGEEAGRLAAAIVGGAG